MGVFGPECEALSSTKRSEGTSGFHNQEVVNGRKEAKLWPTEQQ